MFFANQFQTNRNSYTQPDSCGNVLIALQTNIVTANRKRKRGDDDSPAWTNQKLNGLQARYVFLCRALVDHATSNNNHVLTFKNDAHVYPEYLMVTN